MEKCVNFGVVNTILWNWIDDTFYMTKSQNYSQKSMTVLTLFQGAFE